MKRLKKSDYAVDAVTVAKSLLGKCSVALTILKYCNT